MGHVTIRGYANTLVFLEDQGWIVAKRYEGSWKWRVTKEGRNAAKTLAEE